MPSWLLAELSIKKRPNSGRFYFSTNCLYVTANLFNRGVFI